MPKVVEGKVTKKCPRKVNTTESSPTMGAVSKLDEFILNSQVREQPETDPGISEDDDGEKLEPKQHRSQKGPRLEVATSMNGFPQSMKLDPREVSYSSLLEGEHVFVFVNFQFT